MDPITQQTLLAAAGAAAAPVTATDVFSTVLYVGNATSRSIDNGIDLAGEGGLTWIKNRSEQYDHQLISTEQNLKILYPSWYSVGTVNLNNFTQFNSNGFTIGTYNHTNKTGNNYVSWSFRKAPGFFDVVTWAGNATNGRTVAHDLGSVPEMIITKRTDGTGHWYTYHSGLANTQYVYLNAVNAVATGSMWGNTTPTSTVFTLGSGQPNEIAQNYVGYLFATLSGISKVGSYSGTGSAVNVDCGFTNGARFVLIKRADSTGGDWYIWDTARGIAAGNDPYLVPNTDAAEVTNTDYIDPLSSGFTVTSSAPAALNASGGTYIFLAIA